MNLSHFNLVVSKNSVKLFTISLPLVVHQASVQHVNKINGNKWYLLKDCLIQMIQYRGNMVQKANQSIQGSLAFCRHEWVINTVIYWTHWDLQPSINSNVTDRKISLTAAQSLISAAAWKLKMFIFKYLYLQRIDTLFFTVFSSLMLSCSSHVVFLQLTAFMLVLNYIIRTWVASSILNRAHKVTSFIILLKI